MGHKQGRPACSLSVDDTTKILLVEDNEADFDLTCALLDEVKGKSYTIDWARDYDSAIGELKAHRYDVCLLDHQLGARTGIEFLQHRASSSNSVPVIMLTGSSERAIDEAAMKAGASDFLVKANLNPEMLERAIRYATERHRLLDELERLAKYDRLTGIANRTLFRDFLSGAMARAALDLEKALRTNELEMHFQPQMNTQTGALVGIEGLIRWHARPPAQFIPLAERSGLIVPIGRFVLQRTCAQFRQWQERGLIGDEVRVSVNVSARQLQDGDLVETVAEVLNRTGLSPTRLELELTETAMLDDPDVAQTVLNRFDRMGVRIAMDDFGTGYSSLTYLKRLPIRTLKIDRSFVNDIGVDLQSEAIIKATTGLTNNLGLDVIAEGIEVAEQMSFLLSNGCSTMQGSYFSKALAPAQMERLLRSRQTLSDLVPRLASEPELPRVVSVGAQRG